MISNLFVQILRKFWKTTNIINITDNSLSYQYEPYFSNAIETLQQLKTTFSPLEKLLVVRNTFEQMTQVSDIIDISNYNKYMRTDYLYLLISLHIFYL